MTSPTSNEAPEPRVPLSMGIEYRRSYGRQFEHGRLRNLSLTGAFLETPEAQLLQPSDKITLRLSVSGRERKIAARVVWSSRVGCGIQFLPFSNRDVQLVDDLIYFVENTRASQKDMFATIIKKVS